MAPCCFPFLRRHASVAPAEGSNEPLLIDSGGYGYFDDQQGDQDARRELAVRILPFVPRRVAASFASGLYSSDPKGLIRTWAVPSPRRLNAAVLLVSCSCTSSCKFYRFMADEYWGIARR